MIRATLAWYMIKEYGMRGHEVSGKLGISDAAVSQYLSGKRGKIIDDPEIVGMVRSIIERNIKSGGEISKEDICKVCTTYREKYL